MQSSQWLLISALLWVGFEWGVTADTSTSEYQLLEGSILLDDCPICDRPSIAWPMRGKLHLRQAGENPLFTDYVIDDLSFTARRNGTIPYIVTGSGTLRIGGEVAVTQLLKLDLLIDDGNSQQRCTFTNDPGAQLRRKWPMLELNPVQSNGSFTRIYNLILTLAPLREIWFSTTSGFHPATGLPGLPGISGGDLLSFSGGIVVRNTRLTAHLGIMPMVPDLGLDAVAFLSGGEMVFSTEIDTFSETMGPLHSGDILSDKGLVVKSFDSLVGEFKPVTPLKDPGLDALYDAGGGIWYYSIVNDFIAGAAKQTIRHGDLLSSAGKVLKTNRELLANFSPQAPDNDYGLDAIWIWPSGEIWFSTESGFTDANSTVYGPGDLLSDQGYVVYRNLELVAGFAPVEDRDQFGLDSLFVISDVTPGSPPPRITSISRDPTSGAVTIQWDGKGHAFQVVRANAMGGLYLPAGNIIPGSTFVDHQPPNGNIYYRLLQW